MFFKYFNLRVLIRSIGAIVGLGFVTGLAAAFWGFFFERKWYAIRHDDIALPHFGGKSTNVEKDSPSEPYDIKVTGSAEIPSQEHNPKGTAEALSQEQNATGTAEAPSHEQATSTGVSSTVHIQPVEQQTPSTPKPQLLKILMFSDLHMLPTQTDRTDFVKRSVAKIQPDLIVSLGDNLEDGAATQLVIDTHIEIRRIANNVPTIAALGAHDRYGPRPFNPLRYFMGPSKGKKGPSFDTEKIITELRAGGWVVPVNGTTTVNTNQGPVRVSVVDDPHIGLDDLSVITPLDQEAFSSQNEGSVQPILQLGLAHAPYKRVIEKCSKSGYDLVLCGHTHGGQICVPGYGALISNCDLPPKFAKGPSMQHGIQLVVTAGLGHSRYAPLRLACRPEIRVLYVRNSNDLDQK